MTLAIDTGILSYFSMRLFYLRKEVTIFSVTVVSDEENLPDKSERRYCLSATCIWLLRCLSVISLSLMAIWSFYIFVLSCEILNSNFERFSGLIKTCTENAASFGDFQQRNLLHFVIFALYGFSAVLLYLQFIIGGSENPSMCRVWLAVITVVIVFLECVIGVFEHLAFPLKFNAAMETCTDAYVRRHLLIYTAWPIYAATMVVFVYFSAHQCIERKRVK